MNKPTYEELEKRIKELEKVDNDHKKAEEKLLFQNVYFTELFESSPEAIV
ncbi:MAG: hypothetical protein GY863_23435, partial [bacterium]|nr:hypothetical protein [bacterium]